MKTPRTPSPKRGRSEDDAAQGPASSKTSHRDDSDSSEQSHPVTKQKDATKRETTVAEAKQKDAPKRSTLSTILIWAFYAGLFFFTAESIRYGMKVGGYGTLKTDPMTPDSPKTPITSIYRNEATTKHTETMKAQSETAFKGIKAPRASNQRIAPRGARTQSTARRALKMGMGSGRGRRRGRRRRRNNDLLFLNGGVTPQSPGNVETELALTRVRSNVNIFQPGIGFLPQEFPLILAPAPRRRGRGRGGMGSKGRGMRSKGRGMGMGMGAKGRSGFSKSARIPIRTLRPTDAPTQKPTPVPTKAPTTGTSAAPSRTPSREPSAEPSSQPSVSRQPSSAPSSLPSTQPSLSQVPSISDMPT